jgi:hypothetical protein
MKSPKDIPKISRSVFWDVPIENLDFTKDSYFIINRVFNYGSLEEVADIVIYYGKEYVKEILISSIDLDIFGYWRASDYLGIPENQFRCYTHKPWPLCS